MLLQTLRSFLRDQFYRFLIVGGTGFCIDASVLVMLTTLTGISPYAGRVISFLASMLFTWQCNRHFTFRRMSSEERRVDNAALGTEGASYLLISVIGAAANYLVYVQTVNALALSGITLVIGVMTGSVVGLLINFVGYKYWVFGRQRQRYSA